MFRRVVLRCVLAGWLCAGCSPAYVQVLPESSGPASATSIPTQSTLSLGEKERRDGLLLGLALSGGGSRAAVFGTAVMQELQRFQILEQVDVVSAVSGGAIPATLYALDGVNGFRWTDQALQVSSQDIQAEVERRVWSPSNWLRYWFTSFSRWDSFLEVLDDTVLHRASYRDLNPLRPKLLLNATDARTGEPFVLSEERVSVHGSMLADVPLSRAVYASAAYPGTLPPATLSWGNNGPPGAAVSILLYDGGVADNLGLSTLVALAREADRANSLDRQFPRGCLLIAVDATPRPVQDTQQPLSAASGLLRNNRRQILERVGLEAAQQDRIQVSSFPIGTHGSRCTLWHVALRQLSSDDPLSAQVTSIPTNLHMGAADRDALVRAAHVLLGRGWAEVAERHGWMTGPPPRR